MPVQIRINTTLGDTTVTLFNNAQTQNFQFHVIGNPGSIVFDPGNWILKNNTIITEVENISQPFSYGLEQNYPNPFNPSTTIEFSIPQNGFVTIKVFNVLGKEIATLINEQVMAGKHKIDFNATGLSSGVYFYKLLVSDLQSKDGKMENFAETRKMILLR
ncbi:MAG: T9SS type A sorting domain-containing protein [Ignavibacteriaceae bacterium]|nr:T9SS type A sorting domain-containing protein [Ignavibacteriaceae bacterium]